MQQVYKTARYVRTREQEDKPILMRPYSHIYPAMQAVCPAFWQCVLGLFPELNVKEILGEDMAVTLQILFDFVRSLLHVRWQHAVNLRYMCT